MIEALNEHLSMRAYATPPLVKAIRQEGADIKVNDEVEIDSVLYLGDEGGIACAIGLWGGKTVVVTSLTHLRIDRDHPLAERIQAYQLRRSQHLGGSNKPQFSKGTGEAETKAESSAIAALRSLI